MPRSMLPAMLLPPRDWTTLIRLQMTPADDVICGTMITIDYQLPHHVSKWDELHLLQVVLSSHHTLACILSYIIGSSVNMEVSGVP